MNDGPLIVQSDKTLLLEVDHEKAPECRRAIAPFAELERSPEHVHTYRLTPLGLWNARAAGHDAEQVVDTLLTYSRYAVPHALLVDVAETMDRYGRLRLEKHPAHGLVLVSTDRAVFEEVVRAKKVDENGRHQNATTKQQRAFDAQLPLDGIPPAATRVIVGYQPDEAFSAVERVTVRRPRGRWVSQIVDVDGSAEQPQRWIDITPPDLFRRRRAA